MLLCTLHLPVDLMRSVKKRAQPSASEVLRGWQERDAEKFLQVKMTRNEVTNHIADGNEKLVKSEYRTAARDDLRVVFNQKLGPGDKFSSKVFGKNEKYAFIITRASEDADWQLSAVDIGSSNQLVSEVEKQYGYVYFAADQAEYFLGVESLLALATDFSSNFSLTPKPGHPNTFAFDLTFREDQEGVSRMGVPVSNVRGEVVVSQEYPHLPTQILWHRQRQPKDTYKVTYDETLEGSTRVTSVGSDGERWRQESESLVVRTDNRPKLSEFYLPHYGIDEPQLESSAGPNWTVIFFTIGALFLVAFLVIRYRQSRR